MMDQYLRMKQGLPEDVWLFFRLGDFYEMFFEDAVEASAVLGLTLTKRHTVPMCGVPFHSVEGYIGQAVKAGKRVAIAEQKGTPVPGKLVERELVQVVSAGTLADLALLNEAEHNYIVAVFREKAAWGWRAWIIRRVSFRWRSSVLRSRWRRRFRGLRRGSCW